MKRRDFMKQAAGAAVTVSASNLMSHAAEEETATMQNMIGQYGAWAAEIVGDKPARMSLRNPQFQDVDEWRRMARQRVMDRLLQPDVPPISDVQIEHRDSYDGLDVDHLSWQLSHGPRTRAVFLRPAGARGPLPGVLGLHDHGGNKFFGHEKITRVGRDIHEVMQQHQDHYYGQRGWANEIAKRGYAVLVHDAFTFGSRRVRMDALQAAAHRGFPVVDGDATSDIDTYNKFAGEHEHLMAKSLFSAGTTWPGVFTIEDQRALDYLAGRPEVDPQRLGCAGLSGGGLRTVYLAGIDPRIKCACCVGMMTTWRDYLLHKCHTHTWMIYIPGLPRELDYPEVLGLRVPLPTLILNNSEDSLFTLPEMQRADTMLAEVYSKAGAADAYRCSFYPGPHKFNVAMQQEAFDWFDQHLRT